MYISSVKHFAKEFGTDGIVPNRKDPADVVSMDGGRFKIFPNIGHKKFTDFILKKINEGQLNLSYVTNTPGYANQVLWFDVDKVASDINPEDILDVIINMTVKEKLIVKVRISSAKKQSWILKNKSLYKYHIYMPYIYATRTMRSDLWKKINKEFKKIKMNAELDLSATNIRFEGLYKYERKKTGNYYDTSSNYHVIYPDDGNLKTFYKHVNILKYVEKAGYHRIITLQVNNSNRTSSDTSISSTLSITSEQNSSSTSISNSASTTTTSNSQSITVQAPNSQSITAQAPNSQSIIAQAETAGIADGDIIEEDDVYHGAEIFSDMINREKSVTAVNKSMQNYRNVAPVGWLEQFDCDQEAIQSVTKCCDYVYYHHSVIDLEYQKSYNNKETTKTRFNCSKAENCPFNNDNRSQGHQIYLLWDHETETLTKKCEHAECRNKFVVLDHTAKSQNKNELNDEIEEEIENDDIESECSPENNPSKIKADIFQEISIRYSFMLSELKKYQITDIRKYGEKNSIVFVCGNKSEASRQCPFRNGHIHSKSNHYLVYKAKTGNLHVKCHGTGCETKTKLIWSRKDNTTLPKPNDVDLANLFISIYHDIVYSESDITSKGFYHKGKYYWKFDKNNRFIARRLQTTFAKYVDDLFKAAINDSQEEKQIELMTRDRGLCEQLLKMHYKCKNVIACLQNWLHKPKINWNANPLRAVFPNGVLNLETGEFGASKPEEYINDSKVMGCEYKPRDDEFINKEIHEGLFCKIFPDPNVRKSWLQFISVCFEGRNFKKCAINHGPAGNNGKSKTCEFIIYMLGDYAAMGDVKVLLKGKKDRASLANLHQKRFIVYEEPDDSKAMDTAAMKRFIGGVDTLCARLLYSSEDQIELHNKICINVNCLPGPYKFNKCIMFSMSRNLPLFPHPIICINTHYLHLSGVMADEATLERLIYYPWIAQFVDSEDKIDHPSYKYLADHKYADRTFWKQAAPQLVHYILDSYKEFKEQGRKLYVPESLKEATRKFVYINDPFMTWFERHFKLLDFNVEENKTKFVTYTEFEDLFIGYNDKERILGNKYNTVRAFLKKQIQKNKDLKLRWKKKITNWRISAEARTRYRNIIDKTCQHGQYAGAGLICCERNLMDDVAIWNYDVDGNGSETNIQRSRRSSKLSRRESINNLIDTLENEYDNDGNSDDQSDDINEQLMQKMINLTKKITNQKKRKRNSNERSSNGNEKKKRKK